MLAARADGVGSCLTLVMGVFHHDEMLEILGVPAGEGWVTSGCVSFGYPTGRWAVAPRQPVHDVSYRNGWGTPSASRSPRPVGGLTELTVPFAGTVLRVDVRSRPPGADGDSPRRARVHEDGARHGGGGARYGACGRRLGGRRGAGGGRTALDR